MAELIASGTTTVSSADITLAAGEATTLALKSPDGYLPGGAQAIIEKKSGAVYTRIGDLDTAAPAKVLEAVGTFRVTRQANTGGSFGVDRD